MKTLQKHTPAPWRVSNNIRGIDNVKCWGVEADIKNHGTLAPGMPTFYTHVVANCGSIGQSDARLIAAAPELLQAAILALETIKHAALSEFNVPQEYLEKAIFKAKGAA